MSHFDLLGRQFSAIRRHRDYEVPNEHEIALPDLMEGMNRNHNHFWVLVESI